MKTLLYTLILFIATCVVSCSNNEQNTTTQTENNTDNNVAADSIAKINADSIAKIEAIEKAKADSIAKAKADSLEKINNPHPDLKIFDLRGPVKEVSDQSNCIFLSFDKNGKIIYDNDLGVYWSGIDRDKKGRITRLERLEYTYNNNGQVAEVYGSGGGQESTKKYSYNANGQVIKTIEQGCGLEGDFTTITTYTYQVFDKYGNWTKRTAKTEYGSNVETRTITYY